MSIKNISNNNEIIIKYGDAVTKCFIILTGKVLCYNDLSSDRLVLSSGSIFGFSNCNHNNLTNNNYSWTYNIKTDSDNHGEKPLYLPRPRMLPCTLLSMLLFSAHLSYDNVT